ncbi:MAG TPA: hypothetical protein VEJ18_08920, partial [Planctomycetota bacterium]|nr:hypothetical protein [Planctomycetota bacterium]
PPEALPPGVDPDKLEDLARVHKLRRVFQDTGQKFDPWEVLALMAEDRTGVRREIEQVLRLREENRPEEFTAGALALFERILKVRTAHGSFVRKLRDYMTGLDLEGAPGPATLDIALGFLVAASKGRQRASQWLLDPDGRRQEAADFLTHALGLAASYLGVLQRRADDET